jgi:hypothetical protein
LALDRVIEPPTLIPLLLSSGFPDVSSWLARRSAGDQIGWYEDQFRTVYEMLPSSPNYFLASCFADNHIVTEYRLHQSSACSLLSKEG